MGITLNSNQLNYNYHFQPSTNQPPTTNMSDNLRKGLGEQASEKMTPDSQKSTTEKASESLTGAGDRVAGMVQPEGQKSTGQKLGDATRSGGDDASAQGQGVMKQAQDALGNAGQSISAPLSGATGQKK